MLDNAVTTEVKQIPIEKLIRGQYQVREQFKVEQLNELSNSIKQHGILEPVLVRKLIKTDDYEIIAGERRWRAAQGAGLTEIPCIVKNYTDEETAEVTAIENVIREDLNAIEEARAYKQLIDQFGYIHDEIAIATGKSRTKVTNSLRLLKLDERVQKMMIEGQLSEGHGKIISGLDPKYQFPLAFEIVKKSLSVRQTEKRAKELQADSNAIYAGNDPNIKKLERISSQKLGVQVKFDTDTTKRSGWMKIRFNNNDILAGILDQIGIDVDN